MFSRQAAISTAGLLALVAASAWLAVKSTILEKPHQVRRLTTGIGHGMTNWNMAKTGQLMSEVTAQKMIHFNNDNSDLTAVKGIYYNLKKPKNPPWHVKADKGYLDGAKNTLLLTHHVVLQRFEQGTFKPLKLNTEELTYFKNSNTATSTKFVKFTEPSTGNVSTAIGMHANFNTNKIKLLKNVHTIFEPPSYYSKGSSS